MCCLAQLPTELEAQTLLPTAEATAPRRNRGAVALVAVALAATAGAAAYSSSSPPRGAALASAAASPEDKAPVVHAYVDAL